MFCLKYEHLVIGGGGIRGIIAAGALKYLNRLNLLYKFKTYIGNFYWCFACFSDYIELLSK